MSEQLSTVNVLLSIGTGLLVGYLITKLFKLRASATSLFVATMLAVCSTWIGVNCSILTFRGEIVIACSPFLQSLFFAVAFMLAINITRAARAAKGHVQQH